MAGDDNDDSFVQVDLVELGKLVEGWCGLDGTKEFFKRGWFVHSPKEGGVTLVVGCPTTAPRWRSGNTSRRIGTNDDVRIGGLVHCEVVFTLIFATSHLMYTEPAGRSKSYTSSPVDGSTEQKRRVLISPKENPAIVP